MYICEDCGKIVAEEDVSAHNESIGEYWGVPCFETIYSCPHCGGELEEATECVVCGGWSSEDNGICDDCLDKLTTDENCLDIGEENLEKIKINGFLYSAFNEDEINNILWEKLKEDQIKLDEVKVAYRDYDKSYFAEWVKNKWKENR